MYRRRQPVFTDRSLKGGWPTADLLDGRTAFSIACKDAYTPQRHKTGNHDALTMNVMDWRGDKPVWRTFNRRFATLAEAKIYAEEFTQAHPDYFTKQEHDNGR